MCGHPVVALMSARGSTTIYKDEQQPCHQIIEQHRCEILLEDFHRIVTLSQLAEGFYLLDLLIRLPGDGKHQVKSGQSTYHYIRSEPQSVP